ncbi:hypothetical protein Bbelb_328290 [Branchiostoma belcheri]|nr:hypothetical protein Bbelb_328290 [Branchiostoma belcheri]
MAAGLNLQLKRLNTGGLFLNLSNQGLTSIPEEVFDLTDLESLDVSNNKLTSIPEAIGRLQKLYRLDANGNKLTSLPQAIGSLQELKQLYVHNNNLRELPDGLEALNKLEWLFVKDNMLSELPTKLFSCLNLVDFDAGNNKLSTLPPGVEKLQKLTKLYIQGNQLTEVPPEVCSLSNLEVLDVSNNKLSTLPPGVEKLQKLRELRIDDNQLTEVPPGVCSLSNLEVLNASNNKLSSLPPGVEKLQKLRQLGINGNQLTEVPPGVCSLSNLELLGVSNNKLSTLPPGVEKLQKLRQLGIDDNQLTEVPPGVCSLSNLEVLSVGNNKLSTLPPGVEKLQKLTHLIIQGNQLTEVPPGVCSLSNLEVLNVGSNPIRRLPDDVRRLTRLKTLDVVRCQFEEFPRQVLQLKTLEKLYAGGCKFDTVPDEVGTLQHLWLLSLPKNLLRTLPSTMSHLHNLREVHLWNNKFDTFPEVLCELPAMEKLDISNNNITRLPTALHRADKLKDLDVSGNPLTYPPQDVCAQGTGDIKAFLKQEAKKEFNSELNSTRVPLTKRRRDLIVRTPRGTPPVAGSPPGHISYVTDQMDRIKWFSWGVHEDNWMRSGCGVGFHPDGVEFTPDRGGLLILSPMPARLLNPAGTSRGYIPDGHRRNWDLSFTPPEWGKQAGQEEKGSVAGRVGKVRDVQLADTTETSTETELERKLREKSARMQQQVSQHRGQTAEGMDSSRGSAPVLPQTAGTTHTQADVRPKLPAPVPAGGVGRKQPIPLPVTLKLTDDNTAQDKELLQAFNRLSVKVGLNQWKPIARELGFSSQEIRDIQSVSPDDQMYETLERWRQRAGPAASLAGLEQSLRNLELHQLADLLTRTPKTPTGKGYASDESRPAVGGQLPGDVQRRFPSVAVDRRFPIIEFERLNFSEDPVVGSGGFASVEKAFHRDWKQHVAVKRLLTRQLEGSEQELLYSEARKLNLGSRSDHVISLLGVCLHPNFAIVMPYMENGSLAGLLQDVDVPWALRWRMAHEISLGMTFLHCQNPQILHCDLKAENVLLDGDFHVKVSDFGMSKWKMESRIVTGTSLTGGTITHMPPECLDDINYVPAGKFDVYSFGVLLWEIVTRRQPYAHAANSALLRTLVAEGQRPDLKLIPTDREDVTSVSELMQTCWSQNPEDRPTFQAVSQLMQTCWSQNPEDRPTFQDCAAQLQLVKDRFSREEIRQATITVDKMKAAAPSKK